MPGRRSPRGPAVAGQAAFARQGSEGVVLESDAGQPAPHPAAGPARSEAEVELGVIAVAPEAVRDPAQVVEADRGGFAPVFEAEGVTGIERIEGQLDVEAVDVAVAVVLGVEAQRRQRLPRRPGSK